MAGGVFVSGGFDTTVGAHKLQVYIITSSRIDHLNTRQQTGKILRGPGIKMAADSRDMFTPAKPAPA